MNNSGNKYIVKNSDVNLGGAGGFSLGMKMAFQETQDDYFWVMDDDTIPQHGASNSLMKKAQMLNDKFGFLCSNVRWTDGSSCNIPFPTNNWPSRIADGLVQVKQATFVSVLFTRKIVLDYGIPTKELFIWGDDTEYTTRVTQTLASYFVSESLVIHKTVNNLSGITLMNDSLDRVNRYFYLYRNLIYISRMYEGKKATSKLFLHDLIYSIHVLMSANDKRFFRFRVMLKGIFKGLRFNPKIEKVDS